jgi:hypothetical protein
MGFTKNFGRNVPLNQMPPLQAWHSFQSKMELRGMVEVVFTRNTFFVVRHEFGWATQNSSVSIFVVQTFFGQMTQNSVGRQKVSAKFVFCVTIPQGNSLSPIFA